MINFLTWYEQNKVGGWENKVGGWVPLDRIACLSDEDLINHIEAMEQRVAYYADTYYETLPLCIAEAQRRPAVRAILRLCGIV